MNGKMSYNWQPAATPQGRERLKKLLDQGIRIVGKVGQFGRITAFWKHDNGYDVDAFLPDESWYNARAMDGLEFLDPEPPAPETNLDAIIHDAWAKFNSGTSDDFLDFRDAVKEAIERALQVPPAPDTDATIRSIQIKAWDAIREAEIVGLNKGYHQANTNVWDESERKKSDSFIGQMIEIRARFDEFVDRTLSKGGSNE